MTSCSQEQALSCGKQEQMTTFSCRWPAVSFYFGCVLWVRSIFLLNAVHVFSNWWRYFPNLLVSFLRACVFLVLQCVGLSGTPYWPPLQTTARFSLIWQECWWPWAAFFFFSDLVLPAIEKILPLVSFSVNLHYMCLKQHCALKSVGL